VTRILVVDDEPGVRELLVDALGHAGYLTEVATDGADAFDKFRQHEPDLCIVDVNMPTMNGFEFLERLRRSGTETPVLLLSARSANDDVAKGLRFGADDYVRKPFSLEELLLRVEAILRRTGSGAEERGDGTGDDLVLSSGPITMNLDRHEVTLDGEQIELSATEYRLLETLLERKDRLVTREQLLRDVWRIEFDSETTVVETYISYLRKKIHRDGYAPITTVRGVGYKLVGPVAST
jgi:two-component system OmpR family response regulator